MGLNGGSVATDSELCLTLNELRGILKKYIMFPGPAHRSFADTYDKMQEAL